MLGREAPISVEKARALLLQHAPFQRTAEIYLAIEDSYGMITSRDIFSSENLPSFSRSTVDGYAVNSADTFGAGETLPAYLHIKAEIFMGEKPGFVLAKGEVARIATGGMLPEGADAVLMSEHTHQIDETMIESVNTVSPGENVIQAGEDARENDIISRSGHTLRPQDIGALSGLGITQVWVYEKPRVSIILTGDEIVPADRAVNPGQVRDINSYTLSGLIRDAGGVPLKKGIFRDEYDIIRNAVKGSLETSEMVLITGGTSVGIKDMTAQVINEMGAPGVLFHGVAIKPGKPIIGGVVQGIPVFGLPGHPAAVHVCFSIFIRPVLSIIAGSGEERLQEMKRTIQARISRDVSSSPDREEHIGVTLEERDGELWAVPILGKSGLITALTKADGTAVIPLMKLGIHKGELVTVRLF